MLKRIEAKNTKKTDTTIKRRKILSSTQEHFGAHHGTLVKPFPGLKKNEYNGHK
jgi:hypothetical protein